MTCFLAPGAGWSVSTPFLSTYTSTRFTRVSGSDSTVLDSRSLIRFSSCSMRSSRAERSLSASPGSSAAIHLLRAVRRDSHSCPTERFEASKLDRNVVRGGRKAGKCVAPLFICRGAELNTVCGIGRDDRRAGDRVRRSPSSPLQTQSPPRAPASACPACSASAPPGSAPRRTAAGDTRRCVAVTARLVCLPVCRHHQLLPFRLPHSHRNRTSTAKYSAHAAKDYRLTGRGVPEEFLKFLSE